MRQDAVTFLLAEIGLASNIVAWLYRGKVGAVVGFALLMYLTWKLYEWAGQ